LGELFRLKVNGAVAAAIVLLKFVADSLLAIERAHSGSFDGADVHVGIAASVVWLNEAKALVGVEELHGSTDHYGIPFGRAGPTIGRPKLTEAREGNRSRKAPMTVSLRLIARRSYDPRRKIAKRPVWEERAGQIARTKKKGAGTIAPAPFDG